MITERQGLAVWLRSLKHVRQLRKFGNVHYVSKKMKYAIVYCNKEDTDETAKKIESLHYVKKVEPSMRPYVSTEYQSKVPDKVKSYDYNMGL
ncbi:YlbG family protein [Thalassorhabdus alkalitolerans]|uniref:UPF0298 protein ACFPU1_05680 n=1 Tax=Thalassorhabdus alkalitolerans TaxID=2282697 RepID=A0ABW0YQ77_9BACI|nr:MULTISPECIES: DUF2129 domain-containing protein [Bacillaceae]